MLVYSSLEAEANLLNSHFCFKLTSSKLSTDMTLYVRQEVKLRLTIKMRSKWNLLVLKWQFVSNWLEILYNSVLQII